MKVQDVIQGVDPAERSGGGDPQARVIRVLDPYTVVIDRGRNLQVELGDVFEVYRLSEARELEQTESGSTPDFVKGLGEVVAVYKKTATLRSITPAFIVERRTAIPGYLGGPYPVVVGRDSGEIAPFEDPRVGDLARPAEDED